MLFVEGNHFCPSCEKTGNCQLQAVAYHLNMTDNHYPHFFENREVDASHPDVMIDHNRRIFCTLCVRASEEVDGKNVFAISGRGIDKRLIVNSKSGLLKDSELERAKIVWQKKFWRTGSPKDTAEYGRQGRFLAARGFSHDVIHRLLKDPPETEA
jgi:hypothetical protein